MKNLTFTFNTKIKLCPFCKEIWDGIECDNCGFDTSFDPNWD